MVVRYSLRVKGNSKVLCNEKDTPMEIGLVDGWRILHGLNSDAYRTISVTLELQIPIPVPSEFKPIDNERFSDCTIVVSPVGDYSVTEVSSRHLLQVGVEVIPAHRVILAHHSEVFNEFFTNPMALEADDGVVNIPYFSVGSVGAPISFPEGN